MNIKDKSDLVDTPSIDVGNIVYYTVKIRRLQIYNQGGENSVSNIRVTVYSKLYDYLIFELAYPNEEMRGIATYAGLLEALVKEYTVKIKATEYHGSQEVGFITGVAIIS
ncbi:hypothetical protein [Xenorhabdus lircayensis]|uniref:Uncharacterized protein n=1 Tax=Xenorhabdus lircayensis TaxID=2763499 RepID=A0ABS0U039_9GAMM|nr:hypothetical protein [Xenorhabdus lircayensis]MBI6547232.1 hypothetical protein [Xenorhabdus lircayensis]